jgi:hypothetical protein
VPVQEETEIVTIKGLLANQVRQEKSRRTVFLVNDRFIKSGYLHHAVMAEGILRMVHNQVIFYINRAAIRLISIFTQLKRRLNLTSMLYTRSCVLQSSTV